MGSVEQLGVSRRKGACAHWAALWQGLPFCPAGRGRAAGAEGEAHSSAYFPDPFLLKTSLKSQEEKWKTVISRTQAKICDSQGREKRRFLLLDKGQP